MKHTSRVLLTLFVGMSLVFPQNVSASWQKGFHMVHEYQGDPFVYSSERFKQSARDMKEAGITDVPLVVHIAQSHKYATDIRNGVDTPTDAALREGIQYLQDQGFRVTLKILLQPDDGTWRAMINPYNRAEWFQNYEAKILEYAQVAQDMGVYQYSIGTELMSMTTPSTDPMNTYRWESMISRIRGIYAGKIIYGAQHGNFFLQEYGQNVNELEGIEFWDKLNYIGLSAYYPMSNERQPSVETLLQRWQQIEQQDILPAQQRWNMQILLAEVGYKSIDYTFVSPGEWQRSGAYNETNQANGYQALLQFFSSRDYFAGVHFWDWKTNPNAGGQGDSDYTPQGKQQTLDVLKSFEPGSSDNPTFEPTPIKPTSRNYSWSIESLGDVSLGESRDVTVTVTNESSEGVLRDGIIDVEVYGPNGDRVAQYYYENEDLGEGEAKTYENSFTFSQEGRYVVKLGIFTNGWRENLVWVDNLYEVDVSSQVVTPEPTPTPETTPEPTPEPEPITEPVPDPSEEEVETPEQPVDEVVVLDPEPTPEPEEEEESVDESPEEPQEETPAIEREVEIWWPTDGSAVSGALPLKAILQDTQVEDYEMFWQVDGGVLNQMYNSYEEYPHKQSWIDVSEWKWQSDNRYTLAFVARDAQTGKEFTETVVIIVQN